MLLDCVHPLEEEMVDVVAPVQPEALLIVLQRHPHLRRQADVEEVLEDDSCQRGSSAALTIGHRLQLPGERRGNSGGYEFQFLGRSMSHSVLNSMQLRPRSPLSPNWGARRAYDPAST